MATYKEVEAKRKAGKPKYWAYINHRITNSVGDEFDPRNPHCLFEMPQEDGKEIKGEVFKEEITKLAADQYDDNSAFSKMVSHLKNLQCDRKQIEYFTGLTSFGSHKNETTKYCSYVMTQLQWKNLLPDILACNKKSELTEIITNLTEQMNAIAVNFITSKVARTAYKVFKRTTGEVAINKDFFDQIEAFHIGLTETSGLQINKSPKEPWDFTHDVEFFMQNLSQEQLDSCKSVSEYIGLIKKELTNNHNLNMKPQTRIIKK